MFIKNENNSEKNKKRFFEKIKELKLEEFYDYSESNYTNNKTKIKLKCKIHNEYFFQNPYEHLKGYKSCPYCSISKKMNNETFINKSNLVHEYKFDYSLIDYKNNKTKVKIICNKHGIFHQRPDLHLQGQGCPICRISYQENFIENANKLHNHKYDYSEINYINNSSKINIICPEHGIFKQAPIHHLRGLGCQKCSCSKGETIIMKPQNQHIKNLIENNLDN